VPPVPAGGCWCWCRCRWWRWQLAAGSRAIPGRSPQPLSRPLARALELTSPSVPHFQLAWVWAVGSWCHGVIATCHLPLATNKLYNALVLSSADLPLPALWSSLGALGGRSGGTYRRLELPSLTITLGLEVIAIGSDDALYQHEVPIWPSLCACLHNCIRFPTAVVEVKAFARRDRNPGCMLLDCLSTFIVSFLSKRRQVISWLFIEKKDELILCRTYQHKKTQVPRVPCNMPGSQ
jgi:hypothetical protein